MATGKHITEANDATIEALRIKLAIIGGVAGTFTTELPTGTIATDKTYSFAGINETEIGGITWYNGDSALYDGSTWSRIPFQSLANYPLKVELLEVGKNAANPALFLDDKLFNNSDGAITSNTSWHCTGKQLITPSTLYVAWNNHADGFYSSYMHFFDINGTWLGNNSTLTGAGAVYSGSGINGKWTFTTPSNCYYVGFSKNLPTQTFSQFQASVMIEVNSRTTYEPYDFYIKKALVQTPDNVYTKTEIDPLFNDLEIISGATKYKALTVLMSGTTIYIRSAFNATYDLVQSIIINSVTEYANNVSNFYETRLILVSSEDIVSAYTGGTVIHSMGDEAAPPNYNGTYIGGNHGCDSLRVVTSTGHNKTVADVGSEWLDDSGRKWYILRVVDASTIWMLSENTGTATVWVFDKTFSNSTLTHSANATHTGNLTITSSAAGQLKPAIKNRIAKALLDGETQIIADGLYYCNSIDLVETYDIVNPASALDYIKTQYGQATQPALNNGDVQVSISNIFRFDETALCTIISDFIAIQAISLSGGGYYGFQQSICLNNAGSYPNLKYYMPKSLPITVGARTFDLRTAETINSATGDLELTSAYWEVPTAPPDRYIQFLADSGSVNKIAFAAGFNISKGVGATRDDLINRALYIYLNMRKSYFSGFDGKITMSANDVYSALSFRHYYDVSANPTGRLSCFTQDNGNESYMYMDWNGVISDEIDIPQKYAGKTITVIEKSDNVALKNSFATNKLRVIVTTESVMYGYLVVKFS